MRKTIFAIIIAAAVCFAGGAGYAQTEETTGHKGHGGHDCPMMGKKEMPHKKMHADKRDKGSGWFCPATGRPMTENEAPVCPWCGRSMQRMRGQMMGGMMQGPGVMPCGMGMGRGRMHGCGMGRMGMMPCGGMGCAMGQGPMHRRMGMLPCMQRGPMMHGCGMDRMGMMPCGAMGRGMGLGPMHGRMGMKPCMRMGQGSGETPSGPLSAEDAGRLIETHLQNRGNPNLKLGDVETEDDHFIATIVTQDDSMVDKLKIDKETGWFQSIYQ